MSNRRVLIASAAVLAAATGVGGIALASGPPERFRAEFDGANEVPVADPDASGHARIDVHVEDDEICYRVQFDDAGAPNRGHIHVGAAGVNGGIVVPLFELVGLPADERNDALEQGRLEGCVSATDEVIQQILDNPDGYYVNLHNARYPAGAIRGQLED